MSDVSPSHREPAPPTPERSAPDSAAGSGVARLSLVLPAFNEEPGIVAAIEEADAVLTDIVEEHEILVVDDGSRDGTAQRVHEILADHPAVRLLSHPTNQGYGAALRTGFGAARLPLVAYTDADRQFDLHDLVSSLRALEGHDMVTCYRRDRKDSWLRCAYSRAFNRIARFLFGFRVRDCDCSLKVFRREALRAMNLRESGFLIDTEILASAHRLGLDMAEIGVTHRPRTAGVSTVSVWHALPVLSGLLGLRSRLRRTAGGATQDDADPAAQPAAPIERP